MADEKQLGAWPKESIPNAALLFMRVHELWRRNGGVSPGAFKNHNGGMSTDWEKYAAPEETRGRGREPERNAVVALAAGDVRQVPGQVVEHTPQVDNRAHGDVFGQKDTEARFKLRRLASIVIPFRKL